MKILFVCTGNTCRSPIAEAIFNKSGKNDVELLQANLIPEENRYAEVKVNGEWKGVVYHSDKTGYFSYRFLTEGEI